MNITVRRILFYSFVVLFLISAVCLILYANGYRWNPSKNALEQTGGLVLETKPGGAKATINGRVQESFLGALFHKPEFQTPLRVEYILPGTYEVLLEKMGYWPWKNQVSVEVQKTTYRTDVRLLPHVDAELVAALPEGDAHIVSRDSNSLLIADSVGLARIDVRSGALERVYTAKDTMEDVTVSSGGTMIAWKEGAGYKIMATGTKRTVWDIPVGVEVVNAFAPTESGAVFGNKKGIFIFDTTTGTTVLWRKDIAVALAVHGGTLFFAVEQGGKTRVWQGAIAGGATPERVMDIDEIGLAFHEEVPGGQYLFASHTNGYLIPLSRAKKPVILPQVTDIDATLFATNGVLYGVNPIEVWRFTVSADSVSQDLITRHGNISAPVLAIPETNYVAYMQDGTTLIAQDTSTGNDNIYPLTTFEKITDASFDPKKVSLYVVGKREGVWGVYQESLE